MTMSKTRDDFQAEQEALAARFLEHEKTSVERRHRHHEIWPVDDYGPFYSDGTDAFWRELANGRFHIGRCTECGHVQFPPRVFCHECWAEDSMALQSSPGLGTLVTFTEQHVVMTALRPIAPVVMAVVDLDEGLRLLTWLRGENIANASPGMRCRIVIEEVLNKKRFIAHLDERPR